MGNVFKNVEEITTVMPYGRFFRQLHYSSGQLFVLLMIFHTIDHFLKRRYRVYRLSKWLSLLIPLCLCLFTLFTGFILKGDKEGLFAGQVFFHILGQIPLVGGKLSSMFIVPGESFFLLPYLYHCFYLPLLIIFLIRDHIREWLPDRKFIFSVTAALFLFALLVDPLMDIPPEAAVSQVRGPWFFTGIQALLRILPPIWAGLVLPGLYLGTLIILPTLKGVWSRIIPFLIVITSLLYVLLSLSEYLLRP
jgi:ubiquinol-cytochrome c reductase cytochrome b subunit